MQLVLRIYIYKSRRRDHLYAYVCGVSGRQMTNPIGGHISELMGMARLMSKVVSQNVI